MQITMPGPTYNPNTPSQEWDGIRERNRGDAKQQSKKEKHRHSPTQNKLPMTAEEDFTKGLSEHVGSVKFRLNVLDDHRTPLDVLSEVVVLQCDVFGTRGHAGRLGHRLATKVVLENCTANLRWFGDKTKDLTKLLQDSHSWYHVAHSL